ncbi:NUDIX domain-containing protein [Candidatus Wolfebacteria bacterium]|nr:NUDIX domain-containing protein [Candidatus Wolfebacteria bacterium]
MKEISAGIIIYKRMKDRDGKIDTKYLLLYHGRGYWNFPKGKLEKDERGYQAAFREVEEETSIPAKALKLEKNFKVADKYVFYKEKEKVSKVVMFFLAQTSVDDVTLSEEQEGYGWFLYKDAIKLLKHKNSKNILKSANNHLRRKNTFVSKIENSKS